MNERDDWTNNINDDEEAVYIPGGHRPPPPQHTDAGETRKINVGDFKAPTPKPIAPAPSVATTQKPPKNNEATKKPPTKMQVKRTNYAIILVTTVFVGIIAAVFVFATLVMPLLNEGGSGNGSGAVAGGNDNNQETTNNHNDDYNLPDVPLQVAPGSVSLTGVIRDIRTNRMDLYVFESGEVRSFFVESSSNLRDRFGNLITFPQFNLGDVVELSHAPNLNTVESAQLSAQVRAYRDITGVFVDDSGMLVVGSRRYELGDMPVVRYRGADATIDELDPIDLVTVSIFQDTHVTTIEISRSHGDIVVPVVEDVESGTIEVGTAIMAPLEEEEMTLRVPAGENRITIRGSNIEPLVIDINVPRGSEIPVVVAGIVQRTTSVTVSTNADDAVMYIGGHWFPVNEPIFLEFGTHLISIAASGYSSFEQLITVGEEPLEIDAQMTPVASTRVITLNTSPAGANVYIGGVFRGVTPLSIELEHGRHELSIERTGFIGVSQPIFVTEDESPVFNWMLATDPAWDIFNP